MSLIENSLTEEEINILQPKWYNPGVKKIKTGLIGMKELILNTGLSKTKIKYYIKIGIISYEKLGHTRKFNLNRTIKILKEVAKLRKEGKTIKEIAWDLSEE